MSESRSVRAGRSRQAARIAAYVIVVPFAVCVAGAVGTWSWKRAEAARARSANEAAVAQSFFAHREAFLPGERLRASEELRAAVREGRWWREPEQVPLPVEELAFLDSLRAFDRWDYAGDDSPLESWDGELVDAPDPLFEELSAFLRARHAQALLRGDTRSAILTGRAIARLCFSSSHLVGAMVGVVLLGFEAPAAAAAAARGQDLADLSPIDDATIARLTRAVLGGRVVLDVGEPPEAAALLPEVRAGRCAAIGAAAREALLIRPWIARELEARLRRIRLALDEPGCSLAWLRDRWDRPVDLSLSAALSCGSTPAREWTSPSDCSAAMMEWLPPYRALVADRMLGIPSQDRLRRYGERSLQRRRVRARRRPASSRRSPAAAKAAQRRVDDGRSR